MDWTSKDISPAEQLDAALKVTGVMVEYMGTVKSQNEKIDTGLNYLIKTHKYLKWMSILLLLLSISYITSQFILGNKIANKNTADALINTKEKADIAIARKEFTQMQSNSIKRDSLFNQKKVIKVNTVNAAKVDIVNTKNVNIKK